MDSLALKEQQDKLDSLALLVDLEAQAFKVLLVVQEILAHLVILARLDLRDSQVHRAQLVCLEILDVERLDFLDLLVPKEPLVSLDLLERQEVLDQLDLQDFLVLRVQLVCLVEMEVLDPQVDQERKDHQDSNPDLQDLLEIVETMERLDSPAQLVLLELLGNPGHQVVMALAQRVHQDPLDHQAQVALA